ncbi:dihydrolipoyl dehydrogenase [Natronomonas pharaonis DSM 2160]|uniref:Dihydrolipoyl dehydrogenase n=1 Tax=Natronomonas pharaonis (strain ATCC 35678 / DSM 2160 / CIP 103997 / JCM 8858 / NBRC 14720 / NCIMB 2260 / Gabara) TaxID=348780 RepID=A0A1U7ETB7_NATPD|nr:dihydrolipoyl dehydrogenase [Natronomonas pharaonis]CAI48143.1 dihydrolipoyl dehydrogenase [Natronomonas pharaonis DSM 2160]
MVVGDISTGTELLVVGGGPGGYVAAIRAGQLDVDVTLVEADAYGGTCLNEGCIPSKALIHVATLADEVESAEAMGLHARADVDMQGLVDWKDGVVDQLTSGVEKLCKANGVSLVEGRAEFVDGETARIAHGGEGQGSETVTFDSAVIATGSRPIELPGVEFDGEHILDSSDVLDLRSVPESMTVVGGGYIGMELSTMLAKLGCDVTIVEMLDDILPGYTEDITRLVRNRAESLGVAFSFGERATGWEPAGDGVRLDTETEDGETASYTAENVLVAVGREGAADTCNVEALGLEPRNDGTLETDATTQTSVDGIYAVGDVAGEPMLAHKAYREGHVAAEVVAGEPSRLDYQAIPSAVFTDPEIGTVGLTEAEAEAEGFDPVVGEMPLRASGRALTLGADEGFVRIVADAETGFVLGGQIVGPEAAELVAEVGLAIELGARLEDIAATVHTHPTLSEAVAEAAANARDSAIHTLNR